MALPGSGYVGSAQTQTTGAVFIPELWTGEVKRFFDQKLIASMYTKKISFVGKKADVIHIPNISRAAVNRKLPETPVTFQARTDTDYTVSVTRHMESSFMIEDILDVQSAYNLRGEYTREAGYALARDLDNFVLAQRAAINNFAAQRIFNTDTNAQGGANPRSLDAAAILAAKEILDLADIPEEGRVLLVGKQQYNDLLTIDQFVRWEWTNGNGSAPTTTGKVGELYGIPVVATTQIGLNSATGYINGTGATPQPTPGVASSPYLPDQDSFTALPTTIGATPVPAITALLCHTDWLALAVQMEPRVQSDYVSQFLASTFISDHLYGAKLFRPEAAVVIHTKA
jgi:hypothetical protein